MPRSYVLTEGPRGGERWLLAVEAGVDILTGEVLYGTRPARKPKRWIPGDQYLDIRDRLRSFRVPVVLTKKGTPNRNYTRMREVRVNDNARLFAMRVARRLYLAQFPPIMREDRYNNIRPFSAMKGGLIRRFQSLQTFASLLTNRDLYFGGREDPYIGAIAYLAEMGPFGELGSDVILDTGPL